MQRNHKSFLCLTMAALSVAASAQIQYHVTELPPITGYVDSVGYSLNDRGDVVGACNLPSSNRVMATVWRSGTPSALGIVPRGSHSFATAVSSTGVIAGDSEDGDGRPNTVVFKNGAASFIDSGANNSHAVAVMTNGTIVGNYLKGFGGNWQPTLWVPDKDKYRHTFLLQYIDPTGGPSSVYANGANNSGVVVGQVGSTQWSSRAGLWKNDSKHTLTLLDPLPGEWDSYAFAINDDNVVAGVSDLGSFRMTPVVWAPGATSPMALPLLPGETNGQAVSINNSGVVVGWHGNAPAVWINGNLIDLQTALDASGTGWTISVVYKVNNLGQIVGTGMHNGLSRGFVLTPLQ